ncbi:hypothetical protein ACTLGO_003323, partial [Proteus mirabilis]
GSRQDETHICCVIKQKAIVPRSTMAFKFIKIIKMLCVVLCLSLYILLTTDKNIRCSIDK